MACITKKLSWFATIFTVASSLYLIKECGAGYFEARERFLGITSSHWSRENTAMSSAWIFELAPRVLIPVNFSYIRSSVCWFGRSRFHFQLIIKGTISNLLNGGTSFTKTICKLVSSTLIVNVCLSSFKLCLRLLAKPVYVNELPSITYTCNENVWIMKK